ncbi:hypothetical protein [Stenotrophomonas maltophilia]|uniref:hypothetical protein n=1 Tax=Stenotrophomonas maltophilia TaxID=40324 RepID=UPI00117DBA68|nr:hypothetical protein [Stenotrophomonas maltophilia]
MRKYSTEESKSQVVEARAVDDLVNRLYEEMPSVIMSKEKIRVVVMLGLEKGLRLQEIESAFRWLVIADINSPGVTWKYVDSPLRAPLSFDEKCKLYQKFGMFVEER